MPDSLEYLKAVLCQRVFSRFVKNFWECIPGAGKLIWNWHLEMLCDELQTAAMRVFRNEPKLYDLIINVPFGTSKSSIGSILFQPWVWTFMPHARFLCGTHTDKLVTTFGYKVRAVIGSEKYKAYYPHIKLVRDSDEWFMNTCGGERKACTVGGKTPTGEHAHFVGIDDPIDPEGVRSEAELATAERFCTEVIPGRVVDKEVSLTYLIMQRLHPRDPTHVMLEHAKREGAFPVRQICLPGELTDDIRPPIDVIRKLYPNAYGEDGLLDPHRLNRRVLQSFMARGNHFYSSQILQNPVPPGGGRFKPQWFNNVVPAAPYASTRVLYIDRAATCLVAGTMVETSTGPRPIEKITAGEMVLTRQGFKRVNWSGQTGTVDGLVSVEFSNGSVVTGTPEHLIWDESKGWVPLATLDGNGYNKCIALNREPPCKTDEQEKGRHIQKQKSCGSMVCPTTDCLGNGISCEEATLCTEPYGDSIMEVYPKVVTFITKTATGTITTSPTSNALLENNIIKSMLYLRDGIKHKPDSHIRRNSPRRCGNLQNTEPMNVFNVEKSLSLAISTKTEFSSAQPCVEKGTGDKPRRGNVQFVRSPSTTDRALTHAPKNAHSFFGRPLVSCVESNSRRKQLLNDSVERVVEPSGSIPVYDLEVDDAHEFFANGILVHNSDAGCYTAMVLMAMDTNRVLYVEHVEHGQWEPVERNERIVAEARRCRARYGPRHEPTIYVEMERGSTGLESFQHLARQLMGYKIKEDRPTGGKDVRSEPWADQLAAKNVRIVDDGTWDVEGYVREHVQFQPDLTVKRMGKFKDQVDASSGALKMLPLGLGMGQARVYAFHNTQEGHHKPIRKVVACRPEHLAGLIIEDHPCLLIQFREPLLLESKEVMCNGAIQEPDGRDVTTGAEGFAGSLPEKGGMSAEIHEIGGDPPPPPHQLVKCLDTLELTCADLNPADYQDKWDELVPAYGVPPEEVMLSRESAKRFWNFVLRKRQPPWEVVVICGEGGLPLSAAFGLSAGIGLQSAQDIYDTTIGGAPIALLGNPPNQYVTDLVKTTRSLVIG